MADWFVNKCNLDIDRMCAALGIHKPLAYALSSRGVRSGSDIHRLLDGCELEDIKHLSGMTKSFEILKYAVDNSIPICIYGDYDADGVTSTTILYKSLSALGARVDYFIPNRVEDGYGLSARAVKELAQRGVKLLVACDNGIAAIEEIALAKGLGMQVVVYDHHEPKRDENGKDILPQADALCDAKIQDCGYGFRFMCAGGLCYRAMKEFYAYLGKPFTFDDELLVFAGIATICDVVELIGENRQLARSALELINRRVDNLGLQALIEQHSLQSVEEYHIGFIIGPCINASGRLDTATIAVRLFTSDDSFEAEELAGQLIAFNTVRKALTSQSTERLIVLVEQSELAHDRVLVVYDEEVHESIAGIIAGKLKEKFNKPAIVLTKTQHGAKGSARSIEGYDMFTELTKCSALLEKFGGHTMAAGLSLEVQNINALRCALNDNCTLTEKDLVKKYNTDGILELNDVNLHSARELECLRPYGSQNPKPLFGSVDVYASSIRFRGKEGTIVTMTLKDSKGASVNAVAFGCSDKMLEILNDEGYTADNSYRADICLDIIYNIDIDTYNDNQRVQLKIKDFRKSISKGV